MRVGGARRREGHGGVTRWWRHTHTAPSRPSPRSPTPHVWLCAFAQRGGGRTEQQGRWAPPTPAHAVSSAGVGVWVWHARTRARGHHSCLEAPAACVVKKGGRAAVAAGAPFLFPSPLQLLCSTVPHHTAKHPRKLLWGGWPVGWGLWWRSGKRARMGDRRGVSPRRERIEVVPVVCCGGYPAEILYRVVDRLPPSAAAPRVNGSSAV